MNCIIVHGCPDEREKSMNPKTRTYDKHWMPWAKRELEKKRIKTSMPLMPEPWKPDYENWKKEFEKQNIDENTILIGHSCGCAFLVRWIGDTKKKIYKLILVAPWKIPDENSEIKKKFYNYKIDSTIKNRVNKIIIFTADNEEDDGKKSAEIFHKALNGKLIELKNKGHYTFHDMGDTEKFPELLEVILNDK